MVKVAVIGAAGGIGQPLALLLKLNVKITELALADVADFVEGVAVDVSHIDTPAKVTSFVGPDRVRDCFAGASVVVIPAGFPRKPGMTREDLFDKNATVVRDIAYAFADVCPNAFALVISNPVNSTVPIFVESIRKRLGQPAFDSRRIIGVTALDLVRSSAFFGEYRGLDPQLCKLPVVGGHAGITIVPLLSQATPQGRAIPEADALALIKKIQFAGDAVVAAKKTGSATLSMAQAAARFTGYVLDAIVDHKPFDDYMFVEDSRHAADGTPYFASLTTVGPFGVMGHPEHPIELSAHEHAMIAAAKPGLKSAYDEAKAFMAKSA